jgi:hypothetical protein
VHRAGFPLDHPYLEQCWSPILGPSSVLLLRHTAQLWRDSDPAVVDSADLAQQIGLGKGRGTHSPLGHTLSRIVRFRFAQWAAPGVLDVYTEVRPLRERDLSRVPAWSAGRHDELLCRHLDSLGASPPTSDPTDHALLMAQRLDEFASSRSHSMQSGLGR